MLIRKPGEEIREATAEEEAQILAEEESYRRDNDSSTLVLEMLIDLDFRLMMLEEFGGEFDAL